MKKYDKYKDSDLEWLGKIPEHWKKGKLSYLTEIKDGTHDTPSYVNKDINTYPLVTSKDLVSGKLDFSNCKYISKKDHLDIITRSNVTKNDIIMPMIGTVGSPVIVNVNKDFSIKNVALFKTSNNSKFIPSFLYYLLDSNIIVEQFNLNSRGGVQHFVSLSILRNLTVFDVPKEEQIAIATYLDHKTQQIDTLIEKKEQLIEKLKTKRQTIINETVTKGLNSNDLSKNSNIEYLGKINQNWDTTKIKYSCYVKGRIGWKGLTSDEYLDNGFSYLVTGTDFTGQIINWKNCHFIDKSRYEEDPYIQLKDGDLLLTKDGSIGKTSLVRNLDKPACLNSGIFLVRSLITDLNINFLFWVLNSYIFHDFISLNSDGATIKHLYQNVFVDFQFPIPSISEQLKIQNYLFEKHKEFKNIQLKLESSIQKLKQYRQSLVSEAITGKIDLRDWKKQKNN